MWGGSFVEVLGQPNRRAALGRYRGERGLRHVIRVGVHAAGRSGPAAWKSETVGTLCAYVGDLASCALRMLLTHLHFIFDHLCLILGFRTAFATERRLQWCSFPPNTARLELRRQV